MRKIMKQNQGIVALSMVVFLTIIIIVIALGISTISFNQNLNSQSLSESTLAMSYAMAGGQDALRRISEDRTFSDTTWNSISPSVGNYKIDIASPTSSCSSVLDGCARVRVDYDSEKSPTIITSEGTSGNFRRKVQVDAFVDATGVIVATTMVEIKNLPTASTAEATTSTNTLNGWLNPNGHTTSVEFRYDDEQPPECNDVFGNSESVAAPPSGYFPTSVNASPSLTPATVYYYCLIVDDGSGNKVYGNIFSFIAS